MRLCSTPYTCLARLEDATGKRGFYVDADGDGYGNRAQPVVACVLRAGIAEEAGDCDDTDALAFPGSDEVFSATSLRLDAPRGLLWGTSPDVMGLLRPDGTLGRRKAR